jgi:hypothetical protein
VLVAADAPDVGAAVGAARVTAEVGCAVELVVIGLCLALRRAVEPAWDVVGGRNVIDGSTGWLDGFPVDRPASGSSSPRDGGSNRSTAGTGTWVRKVSANAPPSMTAMTQVAQTPHLRTAARIPESSLNIGRSVLTATESSAFGQCPRSQNPRHVRARRRRRPLAANRDARSRVLLRH